MKSPHLRTAIVTALFGVVFVVIANLAWATAVATPGPWFSPTVTLQMYVVSLLAGIVVAVALAMTAASRSAHLDGVLRSLDVRVAGVRHAAGVIGGAPTGDDAMAVLESLEGLVEEGGRAKQETATAVPDVLRDLEAEREAVRTLRTNTWMSMLGPTAMAIVFVAIAGTMLPGSEGFALSNFRLTTAFVLFLGYGWAPLIAWVVAAVALMHRTIGKARA